MIRVDNIDDKVSKGSLIYITQMDDFPINRFTESWIETNTGGVKTKVYKFYGGIN